MGRPLRLLVVSHAFPPIGEVGSLRIAHLCRYLRDYNVEPIVLTLHEKFYDTCDQTLGEPADVRVLRTTMMRNPLYWYEKVRKRFRSSSPGDCALRTTVIRRKDNNFLRRHILALIQFPDRNLGWYWPAIRAAEQLLRTERVDAMLSSGPPWIAHLIAHRLKEKFAIPWLADFRDPWATLMPV